MKTERVSPSIGIECVLNRTIQRMLDTEILEVDHRVPWTKCTPQTFDNPQTLVPCNSSELQFPAQWETREPFVFSGLVQGLAAELMTTQELGILLGQPYYDILWWGDYFNSTIHASVQWAAACDRSRSCQKPFVTEPVRIECEGTSALQK